MKPKKPLLTTLTVMLIAALLAACLVAGHRAKLISQLNTDDGMAGVEHD